LQIWKCQADSALCQISTQFPLKILAVHCSGRPPCWPAARARGSEFLLPCLIASALSLVSSLSAALVLPETLPRLVAARRARERARAWKRRSAAGGAGAEEKQIGAALNGNGGGEFGGGGGGDGGGGGTGGSGGGGGGAAAAAPRVGGGAHARGVLCMCGLPFSGACDGNRCCCELPAASHYY